MKTVTFIYARTSDETWSTPMSLAIEFSSRGWNVQYVSIGDNRTGVYHDKFLREWIESTPKTDLVIFMDWGRFDSPYLDKRYVPAVWIQESGDDPQNFERNFPKANRFHHTFTPDAASHAKYIQRGIHCSWIPHFADTRVHFPIDIPPAYVAVTTRGYGGSSFLDTLTEWGDGAVGNRNGLDARAHTEFLNSGMMVIQNSRWKEITRRLFEGMACGKLVITDRLPEHTQINRLFIENEDIVYYDDLTDCISKINYYHENEVERVRIANNGRIKLLQNYTQSHVVTQLEEIYETYRTIK